MKNLTDSIIFFSDCVILGVLKKEMIVKKTAALIITIIIMLLPLSALPGSSGELAYQMSSPLFLSQGFNIFNRTTPQAVGLNPAAAAGFQRYILDANYINLERIDVEGYGGMGHGINLALSVPMKTGVVTTAVHYGDTLSYGDTALNFNNYAGLDVAFSKDLYEDVHFGFSLNGTYGFGGEWGASLSAGLLFMYGDIGIFKDATLGAVVNRIGLGYAPNGRGFWASVQENITPAVGLEGTLVDQPGFTLRGRGIVSLPAFSDLKLDGGADINLGGNVDLYTSLSLSAQDLINGDWETIIPGVGINVAIPLTPKEGRVSRIGSTEMNLNGGFKTLYDGIYAFGAGITMPFGVRDKEPPLIAMEFDKNNIQQANISPNYDGIQDELIVPFTVEDDRYIKGYKITVKDSSGNTVKEIYNKDERPENANFSNFFDRLFAEKESVAIPETFRWDGVSDSGETPPDGDYSFTLEFWDDNGNRAVTAPSYFALDNTQPELAMESPSGTGLIFSPDGDGNKDVFVIAQNGSQEEEWAGQIRDGEGRVYRTFTWNDSAPEELVWDGTDDEGEILADGVYEYVLSTKDKAGNANSQSVSNILINTTQPELALTIDRAYLSPDSESEIDSLEIGFQISTVKGLADWRLDIIDNSGRVYRSWTQANSGDLLKEEGQVFDGRNDRGQVVAEGLYQARLDASYQNGFSPVVFSPAFTIDRTAPSVSVSAFPTLFSPDGDGNRDEIEFSMASSEEDSWTGHILDEEGNTVKTYQWHGAVPEKLTWNGLYENGASVKGEKSFVFYVETKDRAGNYGRSKDISFTADTSKVELFLTLDRESLSPNGDGINERILIGVERNSDTPVKSYTLSVVDSQGNRVSLIEEGTSLPESLRWDGGDVGDGTYQLALGVEYERGDRSDVVSPQFLIDRIYPEINLSADLNLFSPDGDGFKDSVLISQSSSLEELFESQVLDSRGEVVNAQRWQGTLDDFSWAGTDSLGNVLPNGTYSYRVVSTDKAGNRTEKKISGLTLDNRTTRVFLTADRETLSPSGKEEFRLLTFDFITSLKEGIESWRMDIIHEERGIVKTLDQGVIPPDNFIWDGRDNNGRIIEGSYTAKYSVVYKKGNRPEAVTAPFVLDNSAPEARVLLNPLPFSPDEDNVDDELTITMGVQDLSAIDTWKMEIIDPKGNDFISYGGRGKPTGRIIWDGRSSRGELVQSAEDYKWRLTVSDVMGNSSEEEGIIPIDVLVIRDGDRLKIMISSITFEPARANLESLGEAGDKNRKILERIAQILDKYNRYQVQVEGHANSVFYYDAAKAKEEETNELQPLSEERAITVMNALIDLGIDANRLSSVGRGGTQPVVDFADKENRWKNRRVEFILVK